MVICKWRDKIVEEYLDILFHYYWILKHIIFVFVSKFMLYFIQVVVFRCFVEDIYYTYLNMHFFLCGISG